VDRTSDSKEQAKYALTETALENESKEVLSE
jgi:hypothetical protein